MAHVTTVDLTLRFLLFGQLRRLREEGFEVAAISAPGPWSSDLEGEGIRHIPWNHATRSWDPAADARAYVELLRIFRRERFDVVHTHNPKPGILGRVAARRAGVPCVMNTVHGLYVTRDDPGRKRIPVLWLEALAARFSDLELYQSKEDLDWAQKIGVVDRSRSVLLGNGADLTRFDPSRVAETRIAELRRAFGIPEGAPVVGTVGRLVAEKGHREFLSAARTIRAAMPEVHFLVVGGMDPEKRDAIRQTDIDGARGDVVFTGWRPDVPDLLAMMDVFVLPSWREGVPRSAIEAAAMGKAMVLTDIRGCREVARDGVEGILVPTRNPERLAGAIARFLDDPSLRRKLGAAARSRAVERFDERRVAESVVATYRQLLTKKGLIPREAAQVQPHGSIRIRLARKGDAPALARIHREALPDAFLPTLGDRFLRRFYRALATDGRTVALVAENGDGVVGFATGTDSVRGFYRRFYRRHGVPAAVLALPRLLRPGVRRRLRETARYPIESRQLPDPELLSIAVAAGWASRGIGRALADGLIRGLADLGVKEIKVVVAANNEAANRFYARLGFKQRGQIVVHDSKQSNVWVVQCQSS